MSAVLSPVDDDFPRDREVAQLRVPPHSIEAESSVLGGLLLDNEAWDRVADLLSPSDFYRYEHRLIFKAIQDLIDASKPADVITVFEALQSLGNADEVGGLSYLNSLAQYVPSAGNIRRYAELVRERAAAGVTLAAFTNKRGDHSRRICAHLGLTPHLRGIFGAKDTPWIKPQPEFATHALAALGADAASTLLVGDSPFDVAAARNGGFACWAVTTGTHEAGPLREAGAERIFSGLPELHTALRAAGG